MRWQPMETAPKDRPILVCLFGDTIMVVEYDEYADPMFPWSTLDGPNYMKDSPTHWMPLPECPTHTAAQRHGEIFEKTRGR